MTDEPPSDGTTNGAPSGTSDASARQGVADGSPPPGALHHLELYASDLDASTDFWEWFLTTLGYDRYQDWDGGRSWRHGPTYVVLAAAETDGPFDRHGPGLNHVAFHAASRSQVDRVTDEIRARDDATVLYEDRHPFAGGEDYYALYAEDPEGIKVEFVAPA